MKPFLAIDWGTSNLRGWRIGAAGDVAAEVEAPLGVARLPPGGAEACFEKDVRPRLDPDGELPVLICGMAGSTLGWQTAPYVSCPADMSAVLSGLVRVEGTARRIKIVPGLKTRGLTRASDVMRGEETQVFGWMSQERDRACGIHVVCHPGTHTKWIMVADAGIDTFVTAMTGELFDVLSRHSILASREEGRDQASFLEGVAAAGDGGALAARLFSARARIVADGADPRSALSYLSGLLVGAEIAALPSLLGAAPGSQIQVIGSARLQTAYTSALKAFGWTSGACDGDSASIAGLIALVRAGALDGDD
jgi:2-dehydro-3-deoxygalactonokinase